MDIRLKVHLKLYCQSSDTNRISGSGYTTLRIQTCKQKMMLVMFELDLAYELIEADVGQGEHKAKSNEAPIVLTPADLQS